MLVDSIYTACLVPLLMTIISPLNASSPFEVWPMPTPADRVDNTAAVSPSSIVTLGSNDDSDVSTYALSSTQAAVAKTVWLTNSHDAVSDLMAHNFLYSAQSDRLNDLGASLLRRFSTDASNFSQKVSLATPITRDTTKLTVIRSSLQIKTASGNEVTVTLANQDDSLAVDVHSSGKLTDKERAAIASLAQGFQQALDGLAGVPPKLDLGGMLQYDSQELSTVDFQTNFKPPAGGEQPQITPVTLYVFHADKDVRSLSVDGPSGKVQLNVNTRNQSLWGNQAQQAVSMNNYLKQFDQAAARGQADDALMKLLKDGFSQLNRNDDKPAGVDALPSLNQQDHALLTGLADFSATVSATPTQPNLQRHDEWKTFDYQASQSTKIDDKDVPERQVSQDQQSHMRASFHTAAPGKPLDFEKQTYVFNQIEDSAQSHTEFAYHKAYLTKALVQQSTSQNTHQLEYDQGHLVSNTTTPKQSSRVLNLLPLLSPDSHADGLKTEAQRAALRAQHLRQVHALIQLPDLTSALSSSNQLEDVP